MTITLYTDPIILEVRQKSHLGVANIKDPETRDNVRAGIEKMEEIEHCIIDAFGQLARRCYRFLRPNIQKTYDDEAIIPPTYTYEFVMSERRAEGRAEPLTAAMHAFVVQYALTKFYSTVSNSELSNKYSLEALDTANRIDELLYTKVPPRI